MDVLRALWADCLLLWDAYRGVITDSLWITLRLSLFAFLGGLVLGTIVAAFRISPIKPLNVVGLLFVEFFRNVPMMSLIILVVYGLPKIDLMFDTMTCIGGSLTCVAASFTCEILRSGINSVGVGQIEAGRSIGLTFTQILSQIVFPQAFRSMVQPFVTLLIGVLLSSSLAGVVGTRDLTAAATYIINKEAMGIVPFALAAAVYVVISLTFAIGGANLEKKVRVAR